MLSIIIILLLAAAVGAYFFINRAKQVEAPDETYVCDECGERGCVCHKEEAQ
ncbi:hypothetical protein ACFL9T_13055 [Thermodesulfobacteriota bacterium]